MGYSTRDEAHLLQSAPRGSPCRSRPPSDSDGAHCGRRNRVALTSPGTTSSSSKRCAPEAYHAAMPPPAEVLAKDRRCRTRASSATSAASKTSYVIVFLRLGSNQEHGYACLCLALSRGGRRDS